MHNTLTELRKSEEKTKAFYVFHKGKKDQTFGENYIMKKVLFLFAGLMLSTLACTKEENPTETPDNTAKAGEITYTLDGSAVTGTGGAYSFQDTAYFVKHEANGTQLSLYFNGVAEGSYNLGQSPFENGKGFISYYPDANNSTGPTFNIISGELKLTKIDGNKISGTFSGVLQKQGSTETMQLTKGSFTSVTAFKI